MSSRRELAVVAGVMLALAVGATWPLARVANQALPGDLGDPLLNTYILAWDANRMRHGFSGLWDAPFFYPLRDTLAFSEHLLGIAVFTAPVQWLTGNPVLVYNLAYLASIALAGLGMYMLARSLWGRRDAAWIGAVAFAFAPYRLMHVGHLQLLVSGWMPISLWGLHRYFATGSRRALAVFAGAFAIVALSNGYFLFFFTVPVAIVVAVEAVRRLVTQGPHAWRRWVTDLAAAAAAILLAITPVALAYLRVRGLGLRRDAAEMAGYSAVIQDFWRQSGNQLVWTSVMPSGEPERALFPGLAIAALAFCALLPLAAALRITREAVSRDRESREAVWPLVAYALVLVIAVWCTFGPAIPGPYRLLLRVLPGMDGLRVPARFIVVAALALAVLASAGAAWALSRLSSRHSARAAAFATVVVAAVIVVEGYGGPLVTGSVRRGQLERAPLDAWLKVSPPGAVIEVPIAGPSLEPFTLGYQFATLVHGHPIVNGYSGSGYALQDYLGGPASPLANPDEVPSALRGLRQLGVRYLIVHPSLFEARPGFRWDRAEPVLAAIERAADQVEDLRRLGTSLMWRLADAPAVPLFAEDAWQRIPAAALSLSASSMPDRVRFATDGDVRTRWHSNAPQRGDEWIRVDLDRERDIAALRIDVAPDGTGDYARWLAVTSDGAGGDGANLFDGSIVPQMMAGIVRDARSSPVVIPLPPNRTTTLWLRQRGHTRTWHWSVSEVTFWERQPAAR